MVCLLIKCSYSFDPSLQIQVAANSVQKWGRKILETHKIGTIWYQNQGQLVDTKTVPF
jgi:hypothetical protein